MFTSLLLIWIWVNIFCPPPEKHYKDKLQHRCCKDGLRVIPMPYSCTRRSLYITEGWECMRAFRYCCSSYMDQVFDTAVPTTPPPATTYLTSSPMPSFSRRTIPVQRRFFGNSCTFYCIIRLQFFLPWNIWTCCETCEIQTFTVCSVLFTFCKSGS